MTSSRLHVITFGSQQAWITLALLVSFHGHASMGWAICGLEHDMQPDVCVLSRLELHDQVQYSYDDIARRSILLPHLRHSA